MSAIHWRGVLLGGLFLAAQATTVAAQERELLTLEAALARAGIVDSADEPPENPRLIGPRAEADAARALVDQARLRPNPEIAFEAENIAGSGAFSGLQATEYTLSLSQRLELGGKRGARVRAAQAEARVATLSGALSVAQLGRSVRERYVEAVAAAARLELARDIVERNRELARIAGVLVDVGREPPLRSLRAEAALAEALAELEAALAADSAARNALAALWGEAAPAADVPSVFPEIEPPATLLASPSALRLQIARAEREAADAAIARERSLGIPDPAISAGVRRFEESRDQAFLVGVSIPFPFSNRNQGNIAAAEARLRAATAREAIARTDFELEVTQARGQFLAAEARVETLAETSLPQAEEALRLVRIGYRNGRFPLIEVLAAAEARDTIREALIQAQEDRGRLAATLIWLGAQ
ncbi:MAG: metal transporter [Erythrobacteraceae bacterium]|uniref:TolC family protein n=2 Tax=Erythrobacteraceae TaxID=335929 RepID=A0A3A1P3E2_9SPHN|nr:MULTISPECIES: TolC family protein [Sphingomonadales]MBL4718592.1 TolC family protein [Erythrobacter sp.]PCH79498.1 MAG: metal transporter [Erythrobacteraceae bacterium]MBX7487634.1 TolC family protein [Qipengyuania aerophila]MBX7514481.1 TolC family protein [Qipengyuania intermedia]MBX7536107.1 TolC family protein [Qipengyuania aestuarii]